MARYNNLGAVKYNKLGQEYNTFLERIASPLYQRLPNARPILLAQDGSRLAVLENAMDIVLTQEVNGEDILTFSLPFKDPKRSLMANELRLQLVSDLYIIRKVTDSRDEQGRPITVVYAEATWYDLQYADPLPKSTWTAVTPDVALRDILSGTGWTLDQSEITTVRDLSVDPNLTNRLRAARQVTEVWGGELKFNTANKTVSLFSGVGNNPGIAITYRKNMKSIERVYNTEDLITRLYPYGKAGLTIEAANNGVPYIENFQYTNAVRVRAVKDERFTNPYYLKDRYVEILNELSKPRVSYLVKAADLSALSGFEHEAFKLGDVVTVYDADLGIQVQTRIIKWSYRVAEPWKTELELSTRQPDLTDLMENVSQSSEALQTADTVGRQDLLNLMVFNYLLNSRADDGFAYWTNNGWTIDNTKGFSGSNSFKCTGQLGVSKTLMQTVWPSHRDNYSLSFRAETTSIMKGPNGKVGIEVVIHYKDGTSDTEFLSLA